MLLSNSIAFVATLLLFLVLGMSGIKRIRSVGDFFHKPDFSSNIIALLVANVTLGTGLAYLLTSGAKNGLLMLVIPVGIIVGYWLLAKFIIGLPDQFQSSGKNMLYTMREGISSDGRQGKFLGVSVFDISVTVPLILVYLLIFAYELFASSKIMGAMIFPHQLDKASLIVAVAIFVSTLVYCLMGGVQAVFRTDKLQLIGIIIFVGLLVFSGYFLNGSAHQNEATHSAFKFDNQIIINSIIAFIAAVATQFYSLLNIYASSNLTDTASRVRLMRWNGFLVALALSPIVIIGATANFDLAKGIAPVISHIAGEAQDIAIVGPGLLFLVVFGMTAVVVSTTDILILSLSYFIYENIIEGDFESGSKEAIKSVRILMLSLFAVAFLLLAGMFWLSADLFYLLLSIANGPIIYVPLIIAAGVLAREKEGLKTISNSWLLFFLFLFVSASFSSLTVLKNMPTIVPYLSIIHLSIASFAAAAIYFLGMKKLRSRQ